MKWPPTHHSVLTNTHEFEGKVLCQGAGGTDKLVLTGIAVLVVVEEGQTAVTKVQTNINTILRFSAIRLSGSPRKEGGCGGVLQTDVLAFLCHIGVWCPYVAAPPWDHPLEPEGKPPELRLAAAHRHPPLAELGAGPHRVLLVEAHRQGQVVPALPATHAGYVLLCDQDCWAKEDTALSEQAPGPEEAQEEDDQPRIFPSWSQALPDISVMDRLPTVKILTLPRVARNCSSS